MQRTRLWKLAMQEAKVLCHTTFIEISESTEAGILLGGDNAFHAMMIAHSHARSQFESVCLSLGCYPFAPYIFHTPLPPQLSL
jgi:hypothetical protein